MRTVFADAAYWIALIYPGDDLHDRAKVVSATLAPLRIVTSDMGLTELLNSLSNKGGNLRRAGVELIRDIYSDPTITVVAQTRELFGHALDLYQNRLDQAWSHTDCASFCIRQQQKLLEALTYDRHFEQAGFIALLR